MKNCAIKFNGLIFVKLFTGCLKTSLFGVSNWNTGFGITRRLHLTMNSRSTLDKIKEIVPVLTNDLHKGQCGRIGIIGGCEDYTGAPYFAAISALKLGADVSHVICCKNAAAVIKSYSPELIVHPILDGTTVMEDVMQWIPRLHVVVIGPGLGRDPKLLKTVANIILELKQLNKPIVIDADGLIPIMENPDIISGYSPIILTPNKVEFQRMKESLGMNENDLTEKEETIAMSKRLGGVTVVKKSHYDVIATNNKVMIVEEDGIPRRCGGQGDLLAGSAAVFLLWATWNHTNCSIVTEYGPGTVAGYFACLFTKLCAIKAYGVYGRSTTTTDLINNIHSVFEEKFEHQ